MELTLSQLDIFMLKVCIYGPAIVFLLKHGLTGVVKFTDEIVIRIRKLVDNTLEKVKHNVAKLQLEEQRVKELESFVKSITEELKQARNRKDLERTVA
jgi:predicted RNA-binding protein Jag